MSSPVEYLWLVPPGLCVLLLGVEALIITLLPLKFVEKRSIKVIAIVLCFTFALGEIFVVKHDRTESFNQHAEDMKAIIGRFVKLDQDMIALEKTKQVQQTAVAYNIQPHTRPSESLRKRTLDLSSEILRFLISREIPPGFGQGRFGQGPLGGGKPSDIQTYDNETVRIYLEVFGNRVSSIRDQLKDRGLTDAQLDAEYSSPNPNLYSIRAIAERLAALADKLPD